MTADPQSPRRPTRGRTLRKVLPRLAVTVALVAWLVSTVDLSAAIDTLGGARALPLLVALGLAVVDRVVMIAKWYPLVRIQGVRVSFWRCTRAYLAAGFAATFLPASVGGDVIRAVSVGRRDGAVPQVGASIVVERIMGLGAACVLAAIAVGVALASEADVRFLLPATAVAGVASLLLVLLPFSARVRALLSRWATGRGKLLEWLRRFGEAYAAYRGYPRTLVLVALATFVEQLIPILMVWVLAVAIGLSLSPAAFLVAVPLSLFLGRLPVAINGLGVLEGTLIYLLGLFGVGAAEALALGLAWRLVVLAAVLPGALFVWSEVQAVRRPAVPQPAVR